ncbi:MAG: hypothetical protein ACFB00_04325 [Parvularculaceae bacterium]
MKTRSLAAFAFVVLAGAVPAVAQSSAQSGALSKAVRKDAAAALAALDKNDFSSAVERFEAAADAARKLQLQRVVRDVSAATTSYRADGERLALAASSTLSFERFIRDRPVAEQILRDDKGDVVKLRVFGEGRDFEDFMFIAEDDDTLEQAGLERAVMAGEPALKKRGPNGQLSVLMMSEKDHALIEIEGDSEEAVMAVVSEIEAAK